MIQHFIDMEADPYIQDNEGTSLASLAQGKPIYGWFETFIVAKKYAQKAEQSTTHVTKEEEHVEGKAKEQKIVS